MLATTLCVLFLVENNYIEGLGKIEHSHPEYPFDPRLCESTGKIHRTFIIGKYGKMEDVLHPVLDCSKVYGYK